MSIKSRAMLALASLATTIPLALTADAGVMTNGTITQIGVQGPTGNLAYIGFSTNHGSCAAPAMNNAYVFDHSTARGKALLSALTAAWLAGKKVNATGTGTCQSVAGHGFPSPAVNIEGLGGVNIQN